jgi:hypothetical protein
MPVSGHGRVRVMYSEPLEAISSSFNKVYVVDASIVFCFFIRVLTDETVLLPFASFGHVK